MPENIEIDPLPENPSKAQIMAKLHEIRSLRWLKCRRPGNAGSVGNTLEDYLGITENNIASADAGEWEIKAQRQNTGSLITLFHFEPEPRSARLVPKLLLPKYGWPHATISGEQSFRATINGMRYTNRGFKVVVDDDQQKVLVHFSKDHVVAEHNNWFTNVVRQVGDGEINPQPYWTFDSLKRKVLAKINNTVFIVAKNRRVNGREEFYYDKILMLSDIDFDKFLDCIRNGHILVDFDARTGHNHGTKFRVKQAQWPKFFDTIENIT
ncbi:MvaI/BcnI family restriction endonuclease [Nanoarchaeota archaeon]